MNEKLGSAVEVLLGQLQEQMQEIVETKKMINSLRRRMGEDPMFNDITVEQVGSATIRSDQFYGKSILTAAKEYLESRRRACPAEEIIRGLQEGGFDFRMLNWKDNDRLRSFTMTLAKNSKMFHRLPNGQFGLPSWYPDVMNKRSQERTQEKAETTDLVDEEKDKEESA